MDFPHRRGKRVQLSTPQICEQYTGSERRFPVPAWVNLCMTRMGYGSQPELALTNAVPVFSRGNE